MKALTFPMLLVCVLVSPLFYFAATSASAQPEPELISVKWEVTEILVKVYWMNGQAIRSTWNKHNPDNLSLEVNEVLHAFSECDDPEDWEKAGYTECDIYMQFPKYVDDERTCYIGHEMMHGFSGDYHGDQ